LKVLRPKIEGETQQLLQRTSFIPPEQQSPFKLSGPMRGRAKSEYPSFRLVSTRNRIYAL